MKITAAATTVRTEIMMAAIKHINNVTEINGLTIVSPLPRIITVCSISEKNVPHIQWEKTNIENVSMELVQSQIKSPDKEKKKNRM